MSITRSNDLCIIVWNLEWTIDQMQKQSENCKQLNSWNFNKVHELIDELKDELEKHKEKDWITIEKLQKRINYLYIICAWLGWIVILLSIDSPEIMTIIRKFLWI